MKVSPIHPSMSSDSCSHFTPTGSSELLAIDRWTKPHRCTILSSALPSRLCRLGRFCAAAGGKRHRHVKAAAHHRPLHLLHRPQWVACRPRPPLIPVPCWFWAISWCFDCLLLFRFSPQLTWRSAVKTPWSGWCPAGGLSAGCLSATGYWTTRSCRPSKWTT